MMTVRNGRAHKDQNKEMAQRTLYKSLSIFFSIGTEREYKIASQNTIEMVTPN